MKKAKGKGKKSPTWTGWACINHAELRIGLVSTEGDPSAMVWNSRAGADMLNRKALAVHQPHKKYDVVKVCVTEVKPKRKARP